VKSTFHVPGSTFRRFRFIPDGVCAPQGFLASGVEAGIKKDGGKDLALIVSEELCISAGTFTTNSVKAAPVLFDLQHIRRHPIRGIVVNSGNANACTGQQGFRNAKVMSELAGKAIPVTSCDHGNQSFLVCSTGRIGRQLPMEKITRGIRHAATTLSHNGRNVAEAIMTTDTFDKQVAVEFRIAGCPVRIGAMAKGAGMIQPGMSASGQRPALHATMLCFLTTDVVISAGLLQECLNRAVAQSFNRITVDGDMSTNDTVLLLANGRAGNRLFRAGSAALRHFQVALNEVTRSLALMIVRDGEGTSKVISLEVTGAASAIDAERAVRAIGNSTLVKCSWGGGDPNWGRICDAIGYSGARFNLSRLFVRYNDILLVHKGLQVGRNLKRIHRIVRKPVFSIICGLGLGKHRAILYTTDLTEKYVELNKSE